jgi:CheY-like chemotaxis protein/two-component sensor histidine kinase
MLEINISGVVKEALKMLRASLPSTVKIHSLIDEKAGVSLADPTQVHQVVVNVCTNAVHAMGDKGGIIEVKLDPVELDESLAKRLGMEAGPSMKLSIQDDGPGIPPEIVDRIFDPFFTTKKKGEGTGLGLSVVHGILKNHRGAIKVGLPPRRGTVFDIYFPRLTVVRKTEVVEEQVVDHKMSVRIMLVDDEPALVKANTWMLEHLGHEVVGTTSSLEALKILKNQPDSFDLVLTDQTMPEMTGRELARQLFEIRPDLPVVLCSGFSEMTAINVVDENGIKDFLMKPISVKELDRVIQRVMNK